MTKKLLLFIGVVAAFTMNAQSGRSLKNRVTINVPLVTGVSESQRPLPASCFTVSTLTGTQVGVSGIASNTDPGCSPNAGYVNGTNCYGDKEKANFFRASTYSTVTSPSVNAATVYFYKNGNRGTGGTASITVTMKLYAGTSNTVAPGALLGSTVATMGQILAAQGGSANTVFPYTFSLTAVAIPTTGFYVAVTLPGTAGDTVLVPVESPAAINNSWEKESDSNWYDMNAVWQSWTASFAMTPNICGTLITGISKNSSLSKSIILMPNPSTGLVNISVNLATKENLEVLVSNSLGQIVNSNSVKGIISDNLKLDLSDQPNGVYFVSISSGTEKMVQRLIINK